MQKQFVTKKVRELLHNRGISLTKFGEILGSRGCQQARIDRANRFLQGEQKSISFDEITRVAKFFDKPVSYFLPIGELREERDSYGRLTLGKIEKMSVSEIEQRFKEILRDQPGIFRRMKTRGLDEPTKRAFVKAFHFGS